MTIGIGGVSPQQALEGLKNMTQDVEPIALAEFEARITKAQQLMQQQGIDAVYLNAGTNLYYFTGMRWFASERMVGAILPAKGEVQYIAPAFELDTIKGYMLVDGTVNTWHEDESPYVLLVGTLVAMGIEASHAKLAIDESTSYFISNGIAKAAPQLTLVDAKSVTAGCRMIKSPAELALIQQAMNMTIEVHKAAASMLYEGITTDEVSAFIDSAHRKVGAKRGSYFCIVLFGEDTAYPHGVKSPKSLDKNDTVLIDTGCQLEGYNSDITRTYVYGEPSTRQRELWQLEQQAQLAAFNIAKIDLPCGDVDTAARQILEQAGFGPGYAVPGLPHRTGHGIGLDIHEWPYLVKSDRTPLVEGMCFSNEPMLCVPGEFGVRHEDHFYMTTAGAKWFTLPAKSIDDPFYLGKD
ncbi:M24 family metallopeptidase [Shewanella sp. HL-SH5]|uniref:M24 family metallopeptidase n=1 Tax=Shewanella sp. HL-SH5 TaxID=3436241 RepID=UPI003EC035E7